MGASGVDDPGAVEEVLRRVLSREATEADVAWLRAAVGGAGAGLATASGSGAIAIGGSVIGSHVETRVVHLPLGQAPGEALALLRGLGLAVVEVPTFSLPPRKRTFVGRTAELDRLCALLQPGATAAIAAVKGIGGIGKTELAVEAAHRLVSHYSDAVIFVDLLGKTEPKSAREAKEEVIRHFEPQEQLPSEAPAIDRLYLGHLGRRQALLILDNARDAAQVRDLLPPSPSVAIVTSRAAIHLDDVVPLPLDDLPLDEAKALVATIVGTARSLSDGELAAVATACRRHPLALKVVAIHLRDHRATPVLDHLARIEKQRDRMTIEGLADHDIMAVVGLSVGQLDADDPDLASRWRDLAVFPADFDFSAAGAFWGDEEAGEALERLERLETRGLVEATGEGRFRLHDLLREFALLRRDEAEVDGLRFRHAEVYLRILQLSNGLYLEGGAERIGTALALFDRERTNIGAGRAFVGARAASNDTAAGLVTNYAADGAYVINLRLHPREWIGWWQDALEVYRKIGDHWGEGAALGNLGNAHALLGETAEALGIYERRLVIARLTGDRSGEGSTLANLGNVLADLGETAEAIKYFHRGLTIAREFGDRRCEGNTLGNLGIARAKLGEIAEAIECHKENLVIVREIGDRRGEGNALGNLGNAYAALGEFGEAIGFHEQALVISREIGDCRGDGENLINLGVAHASLGDVEAALEFTSQALALLTDVGEQTLLAIARANLDKLEKLRR